MLLYASGIDPYLEVLVNNADRVFYFNERQRAEARIVVMAIQDSYEPMLR